MGGRIGLLLGILSVVAGTGPASAQIDLIEQGPMLLGSGSVSDGDCTSDAVARSTARAEDFVVGQPVWIETIEFEGEYTDAPWPDSSPLPFRVRFHADAAGVPGPVLVEPAVTMNQDFVIGLPPFRSYFLLRATFPAVLLQPGRHWVEIFETDGTTRSCFRWFAGEHDAARSLPGSAVDALAAPGSTWENDPSGELGRALRIAGRPAGFAPPIPALGWPGCLALAGGLAVIALHRLRP
jgi:hypothetical protein